MNIWTWPNVCSSIKENNYEMILMLKLANKDFKVAIITTFRVTKENMFVING